MSTTQPECSKPSRTQYRKGCRCEACRFENARASREWRAGTTAQVPKKRRVSTEELFNCTFTLEEYNRRKVA